MLSRRYADWPNVSVVFSAPICSLFLAGIGRTFLAGALHEALQMLSFWEAEDVEPFPAPPPPNAGMLILALPPLEFWLVSGVYCLSS